MSPEYVQRILPMADNTWDIKILFEKNPLCSLQPQEVVTFCQYYDILCSKVHLPSGAQKKVIDALFWLSFMTCKLHRQNVQCLLSPFNSGEYLFKIS